MFAMKSSEINFAQNKDDLFDNFTSFLSTRFTSTSSLTFRRRAWLRFNLERVQADVREIACKLEPSTQAPLLKDTTVDRIYYAEHFSANTAANEIFREKPLPNGFFSMQFFTNWLHVFHVDFLRDVSDWGGSGLFFRWAPEGREQEEKRRLLLAVLSWIKVEKRWWHSWPATSTTMPEQPQHRTAILDLLVS